MLSCNHLLERLEVEVDYVNVYLLTILDTYDTLSLQVYSSYVLN